MSKKCIACNGSGYYDTTNSLISLGGQFVKAGPDDSCQTHGHERCLDRFFFFPTEDVETVRQLLDSTTTLITVYEEI